MSGKKCVTILDYKASNMGSLVRAIEELGLKVQIASEASKLQPSDFLVLPGVGSYGPAASHLRESNIFSFIKSSANLFEGILGICLGMQLLVETSEEAPNCHGLSVFKGTVRKLPIISNTGWRQLTGNSDKSGGEYHFYNHSYYCDVAPKYVEKYCYVSSFLVPAIIKKSNFTGVQFHPEKSQLAGHMYLKNYFFGAR